MYSVLTVTSDRMKISDEEALNTFSAKMYQVGCPLAQLVERVSHVQRDVLTASALGLRPGQGPFTSGYPDSLSPCFLSPLKLSYQ